MTKLGGFARAVLSLAMVLAGGPPASTAAADGKAYVLLVGCTVYPALSQDAQLEGPANDVDLMADTLHQRFGIPNQRIVVLSEAQAATYGDDGLPTRENIQRRFEQIAELVEPGDRVAILMAGHGSQQPEPAGANASEPDGLDEIFLPRDVGSWDSQRGTVTNAIVDDEIGRWLEAIVARKARVWIVFDSCHSGTMIRGTGQEKLRRVDPNVELGIPEQTMQSARRQIHQVRPVHQVGQVRGGDGDAVLDTLTAALDAQGGLVAIYAAQPNEVTIEGQLPPKNPDAKPHGLLTYALCQVIAQTAERSAETLTYAELAQRVMSQYVQWERTFPTPLVEGADRDREILGEKTWAGRSQIVLAPGDHDAGENDAGRNDDNKNDLGGKVVDEKGFKVTGGALHGLTPGSILAVYPPPGQGEQVLGHVQVDRVRTLEADARPCAYGEMPTRWQLPIGGVCKLVYRDFGDQQLKVAVARSDLQGQAIDDAERHRMYAELEKFKRESSLVLPVEDVRQADWLLRRQQSQWLLMPAAGLSQARDAQTFFGPVPADGHFAAWLVDRMSRIARAENLLKLAATSQAEQGGSEGSSVAVQLEIRRAQTLDDKQGNIPVAWPQPSLTFHAGDLLIFKIINTGHLPADITILYVDSSYGISSLFPQQGELNRLQPGEAFLIPPVRITTDTTGLEHMIALAIKGEGQPVDFSGLEQPRLEAVRTRGLGNQRGLATPLGLLLQAGLYGQGITRGLSRHNIQDYSMQLYSWRVSREPRLGR